MQYADAGVGKSMAEVTTQLGDSDLNLIYHDIILVFDPTAITKTVTATREGSWVDCH